MANSQDIKNAADAVLSAKGAFDIVQADAATMASDLNSIVVASPEYAALASANAAYDVVYEAAKVTVDFATIDAAYVTAQNAYRVAVENLLTMITSYDGT